MTQFSDTLRSCFLIGLLVALPWLLQAQVDGEEPEDQYTPAVGDSLRQMLPEGKYPAWRMKLTGPDELVKLNEKLNRAIQKNSSWYEKYSQTHGSLLEMPYHKKLGLSKKDFLRFKQLYNFVRYEEDELVEFRVVQQDDIIRLECPSFPQLDGAIIHLGRGTVKVGARVLRFDHTVDLTRDNAIGRCHGYAWKFSQEMVQVDYGYSPARYFFLFIVVRRESDGKVLVNLEIDTEKPGQEEGQECDEWFLLEND